MPEEGRQDILLPENEERKIQLHAKLDEYRGRLLRDGFRPSNVCKIRVLERLLRDGAARYYELRKEVAEELGNHFDRFDYDNAYYVIEDYCLTGGKKVHGGTGLPPPPQQQSNP